MKRYWLVLAAAVMVLGAGAGLAQTEGNSSRATHAEQDVDRQRTDSLHSQGQGAGSATGSQQGGGIKDPNRDMRDAPSGAMSPAQQRDMRRPPAGGADVTPGETRSGATPGEDAAADARVGDGGNAGLVIGGLFLALIVFILYRRSRRVDTTPYNRP